MEFFGNAAANQSIISKKCGHNRDTGVFCYGSINLLNSIQLSLIESLNNACCILGRAYI